MNLAPHFARAHSLAALLLLGLTAAMDSYAAQATRAISVPALPSVTGSGNAYAPEFSANGRYVAFLSHASNLVTNDDLAPHLDLFVRDLVTRNTILVSVNVTGHGGGNDSIGSFSLSSNGNWIAFETAASNLVPGDTNGTWDIFLRDLTAGTTRLVSTSFSGTGSANGASRSPQISADGRRIAFESSASDLVPGDTNGLADIFFHDLDTGLTSLVSADTTAAGLAAGGCDSPALSADGHYAAFVKRATNAIPGSAASSFSEIYLRDLNAGITRHVSTNVANRTVPGSSSFTCFNPAVSVDGSHVAFLLQTPGWPSAQLFWRDMISASATSVSSNVPPDALPSMSGDGRFLAYVGGGTTFTNGLYMWDGAAQTNRLVCPITPNPQVALSQLCGRPALSADGTRVAFFNYTNFLTAISVSIHDWASGSNRVISLATNGSPAPPYDPSLPVLSTDGQKLAFESAADNLVAGDENGAVDIFVLEVATGGIGAISQRHSALPALTGRGISTIHPGALSGDGRRVVFLQFDNGLRSLSSNRWADAVLRDWVAGTNALLSANYSVSASFLVPPTNQVLSPRISSDGRYVLFGTRTGQGALNDVIWRDLTGATNKVLGSGLGLGPNYSLRADGRVAVYETPNNITPLSLTTDVNFESDVLLFAPERSNRFQGDSDTAVVSTAYFNSFQTADARSQNPLISADGGWIAFESTAWTLTADPDPATRVDEIYVARLERGTTNTVLRKTKLVSYTTKAALTPSGTSSEQPIPGGATNAVFCGNGEFLFFESGVGVGHAIYRHDLNQDYVVTLTYRTNNLYDTNRARLTNVVVCTNCTNAAPDFSGNLVAYESPSGGATRQIWLRDLRTGSNELISVNVAGSGGGNGSSTGPQLSRYGRFVVFTSKASDLVANDTNRAADVFVRDRWMHETVCLSRNQTGLATGNRASSNPILAPDGRTVAFQSFATDLVPGDYNDTRDVFVTTFAESDTDGDGIDDEWELAFFNTLARDGSGDFDGDGAKDADEFRACTDPTNPDSTLRIVSVSTLPDRFAPQMMTNVVSWTTTPGRSYRIQYKPLIELPWIEISNDVYSASASAASGHVVTNNFGPFLFYRVRLVE